MSVSKRVRYEVLRRDGFQCRYCHAKDIPLEVDHVIPVALGGSDDPTNLVAACKACNIGKSSVQPDEQEVADVNEKDFEFRQLLIGALTDVTTLISDEEDYVNSILSMWESTTELDATHCLPLPNTWKMTVRHWFTVNVPDSIVEYAFEIAKERYDARRLYASGAFGYAAGIVGNRMKDVFELARKEFERK